MQGLNNLEPGTAAVITGRVVPNSYSAPPKRAPETSDDLIFRLCSSSEIKQVEAKELGVSPGERDPWFCIRARIQPPGPASPFREQLWPTQSPSLEDLWCLLSA